MTRINVVPPKELTRQHLVAEYRELPRVFKLAEAWYKRNHPNYYKLPKDYTLGTGHVKFFYTRLGYLKSRFAALVNEMESRGYSPNFKETPNVSVPLSMWKDWTPTSEAISINKARILERLSK